MHPREFTRSWVGPQTLPNLPPGRASVDPVRLAIAISRAHLVLPPDASRSLFGRKVGQWAIYRYTPILRTDVPMRLLAPVSNSDRRKVGIIAEDFGLGFAVMSCRAAGVGPLISKWEMAHRDWRRWLREIMDRRGYRPVLPRRWTRSMKGADFVGFGEALGTWVACEAKGTTLRPTPGWLRGVATKAVSQAGTTAGALPSFAGNRPLKVACLTHISVGRWMSRVTLVDPPELEAEDDATVPHEVMREMAFAAHFNWLAAFLGLPASPWRARRTFRSRSVGDRSLVGGQELSIEVSDGQPRTIVLGISPEVVDAARAGDMQALDDLAAERVGGTDWLVGMTSDTHRGVSVGRTRSVPPLE